MRQRIKLDDEPEPRDNYFLSSDKDYDFVSSGCTLLDCALGGGMPLGRIVNIVGDKSTAKTGIACETVTNFIHKFNVEGAYRDVEAAFDESYAEAMGLPIDMVDLGDDNEPMLTVEAFYKDLDAYLDKKLKSQEPGIYVLDSLDALSDEAEQKRDLTDGTYGMNKQKQLGVIFRMLAGKIEASKVLVVIISQVRENIGVSFGEKYRRSGGKAMDFYASQIFWLAHLGQITKTVNKVKRPIGIEIKAKVKKNKVGFPFREAEFDFIFGYGIDDLNSNVEWLKSTNNLAAIGQNDKSLKEFLKEVNKLDDDEYHKECQKVADAVKKAWNEVEESFMPTRRKYR